MSTEFPFPKPNSLTVNDAAKWYRAMVPLIPKIRIDDAFGDSDKQRRLEEFKSHWKMKARLRWAAALSLDDPEMAEEFFKGFPLPSVYECLGAAFAIAQDGSAFELALTNLLEITEEESRFLNPVFFVHVGDGLYRESGGEG